MARPAVEVTYTHQDPARIPELFNEGIALLFDLYQRKLLERVGQRLHIRRQGGYCGLDAFIFLLLYFTTGANTAIKNIDARNRPHNKDVAALLGRNALISSSALGRALSKVENDLIRPEVYQTL